MIMPNQELKITVKVVDDGSGKLKAVGTGLKQVGDAASKTELSFGKMALAVAGGQAIFSALVGIIRKVTSSVTGLTKDSVEQTLKFKEMNAVLPALAANMGVSMESIEKMRDAITAQNKSMIEATEVTFAMVEAGLKEKQALQLINAARDVGAAKQISSAQASQVMLDAALQLNPTMLKTLGMTVRVNDAYDAMAETLGVTREELTTTQKQQAIFNAAVDEASKFAGAYDLAMTSAGKKMRSLQDSLGDVKLVIGDLLDDALMPIITVLYEDVKAFRQWLKTSEEGKEKLRALAETIGKHLFAAFMVMRDAVKGTIAILRAFKSGITALIDFLRPAVMAIAELLSWLNPFARHSPSLVEQVREGVNEIVKNYRKLDDINPALRKYQDMMRDATDELKRQETALDAAKQQLQEYKDKVDNLRDSLDKARDRINALNDVQLKGTRAHEDALFQVNQQIKQLQLEEIMLKQSGASEDAIDAVRESMEGLRLEADRLRLSYELDTDPLKRQVEQTKDRLEGSDVEMSFGDIIAQYDAAYASVAQYESQLASAESTMRSQQQTVDTMSESYDVMKSAVDDLKSALSEAKQSFEKAGGGAAAVSDEIEIATGTVQDFKAELEVAKEKAKAMMQDYTEFADNVRGKIQAVTGAATDMWAAITDWEQAHNVTEKAIAITGKFTDAMRWLADFLRGPMSDVMNGLTWAYDILSQTMNDTVYPSLVRLTKSFENLSPVFIMLANFVKDGLGPAMRGLWAIFIIGIDWVLRLISALFDLIAAINNDVAWAFTTFKGWVEDLVYWVKELVTWANKAKDALTKLNVARSFQNFGANVSQTFGKAVGGAVNSGQSYIVGERGPELFVPAAAGAIMPSGAGGVTLNVSVVGNIASDVDLDSVATRIGDTIIRKLKMTRRI